MDDDPALVPELTVTDCAASMRFWCGLLGFEVVNQRADEGFAHLALGRAHVMLDQADLGRTWRTAGFEPPLGRGINLQVQVPSLDDALLRLGEVGWPLFLPPEEKWYRVAPGEDAGVRQFLVQDPDGYLVRLQMSVGHRRVHPA